MSEEHPQQENEAALPRIEYGLIKAHGIAALAAVVISGLFGLFIATKMHMPDMAGTHAWSSWGRLRFDHTQGIFFGWLGNAFLMFLYHIVPRLSNREVFSKKLGWFIFAVWNFAILIPGWILCLMGQSQSLEWAEFPLVIDIFVVAGMALATLQFVQPLLSNASLSKLYVSGWYIIGGLIFTLLAYPLGNFVPQLVSGAKGAAFSGLWIHDAVGLFVTPLALAISYWVIPAVTRRPIFSHFLSMIGFWLLFFVYPLNGTHHYVYSSIPMETQVAAVTASAILGIDVILVVTNLLLSMKGAAKESMDDTPLRYVLTGTFFYLIVSLQGSLQALMPINKLVHFSDWVIGHAHLAMVGFASFTVIGGMGHIWQRIPEAKFNAGLYRASYWLIFIGMLVMVGELTLAGLVEANIWQGAQPWIESVRAVKQYWLVRTGSGAILLIGFLHLCFAFCSGKKTESSVSSISTQEENAASKDEQLAQKPAPVLNMAYLSASIAGVGFFLMSFSLLGIAPGLAIESDVKKTKPKTMIPLTASEEHGREVYAREGCAYCHTQQVRKVESDAERFGMPTRSWETVYDYPQLWGTRRIGPDLARESSVRTDDWQLAHLYNPRLIVSDSVMPPYPWLFDGSIDKPNKDGRDLLAYIKSLGRARELSGIEGQPVPEYCQCSDDVKKLETTPIGFNANASKARRTGPPIQLSMPTDAAVLSTTVKRGETLFAQNCASCHGAEGRGDGKVAANLMPAPANLRIKKLSAARISFVLENGVYGTSMPAWRDMAHDDLVSLASYVSTLSDKAPSISMPVTDMTTTLFKKNCASCHGTAGGGDGPAAGAMAPVPTNFHLVKPSIARALMVINDGIPGTSMPPWKDQLSLPERAMLASYVSSMYKEEGTSKAKAEGTSKSEGSTKPEATTKPEGTTISEATIDTATGTKPEVRK